ncbi:unnamed protein product [Rhodiola kirilowii]
MGDSVRAAEFMEDYEFQLLGMQVQQMQNTSTLSNC